MTKNASNDKRLGAFMKPNGRFDCPSSKCLRREVPVLSPSSVPAILFGVRSAAKSRFACAVGRSIAS